ncbi:uncharacterized protein CCR75_005143 [Bremia lactucae]|uniref:Uncharacterized protein n=1 Tax=Bremia lactucae TaxID=4779 RepID=A0A976FQ37_BRELC|nr:hypothetical protein CCR75_005143 [Bremia lactucae]
MTSPVAIQELKVLVQLHRIFWRYIAACDLLLCGMDDLAFLLSVARVVCEALTEATERFWCYKGILELFHSSLELVGP